MLSCLLEFKPSILLRLFNSVLNYSGKTPDWYMSILVPIYKKGSKMDPSNYRGISLICCVNKLFAAILNKRLIAFTKDNNILAEEQLGFVKGNRTSDAHFIINNLIQDYCHKKGKQIYSCLIDFKKAFDSIPRDILFKKLKGYGVTGNFFNILKNMYNNDSIKIKIGERLSENIYPNQGVRQGCILSPTLFNIFLADLPGTINKTENHPVKIGDKRNLSCIIWADDVIMFSQSEKGLQNMILKLASYTEDNSIEINADKTKCMIFNKTGRLMRRNFKYKNANLETVREYKYLGFILTPSGEISSGLKDLKDRGNRAAASIRMKMGNSFRKNIPITLKIFKSLVMSILLYMADYWGCLKMPKNNPIEIMHNKFIKQILGVQTQTTTVGILLETGEIPISCHAKKICIKNWCRIIRKKCNNIVLDSYITAVNHNINWPSRIREELSTVGLLDLFLSAANDTSHVEITFFQRSVDIFHQNGFAQIRNPGSKLRTYSLLKTEIGLEKYLTEVTSVHDRTILTKLRLSNHSLMIEKGRHLNLEINQRLCPLCSLSIEDELHFVMFCNIYQYHRNLLLQEAKETNTGFQYLNAEGQFNKLLGDPKFAKTVAKYLSKCFETRTFLMSNPKNTI